MLSHARNLQVLERRILPDLSKQEGQTLNANQLFVTLKLLVANKPKALEEGQVETLLEAIVSNVVESQEKDPQLIFESIRFLTLLTSTFALCNLEAVRNFFDDHFLGLPQCLRMSV